MGKVHINTLVLLAVWTFCGCQDGKIDSRTGMDAVEKPWPVWAVTFSPDGCWLAAGRGYRSEAKFWLGGKGEVNVWKVENWNRREGFTAPFTIYVEALSFAPDSKQLVAAADKYIQSDPKTGQPIVGTPNPRDGTELFVWTVPDGSREQSLHFKDSQDVPNRIAGFLTSRSSTPAGELIALGCIGDSPVVFRRSGEQVSLLPVSEGTYSLAFSPNGKFLASINQRQSLVHLYDTDTGKERSRFQPKCNNPAHVVYGKHGYELAGDILTCVRFSPDGKQIAVGVSDGSVRVLAADLSKQLRSLEVSRDKEWVVGIASAPKTDLLAAATPSSVRLFETSSGKQLQEWGKPNLKVSAVTLSPDGKLLAAGCGGKHNTVGERRSGHINIWDTATGRLVKKLD